MQVPAPHCAALRAGICCELPVFSAVRGTYVLLLGRVLVRELRFRSQNLCHMIGYKFATSKTKRLLRRGESFRVRISHCTRQNCVFSVRAGPGEHSHHLFRNSAPLGPYSRPISGALWWSLGKVLFLVSEVPLYDGHASRGGEHPSSLLCYSHAWNRVIHEVYES